MIVSLMNRKWYQKKGEERKAESNSRGFPITDKRVYKRDYKTNQRNIYITPTRGVRRTKLSNE